MRRGNGGGALDPADFSARENGAAALVAVGRTVLQQLDQDPDGLPALAVRYQVDRMGRVPAWVERERIVVRIAGGAGGPAFARRLANRAVGGELGRVLDAIIHAATLDLVEQFHCAVPVGTDRADRGGHDIARGAVVVAHVRRHIVEAAPILESRALQLIRPEAEEAMDQDDRVVVGRQDWLCHAADRCCDCHGAENPAHLLNCERHCAHAVSNNFSYECADEAKTTDANCVVKDPGCGSSRWGG